MATTTVKTQTPALLSASASTFYTVSATPAVGNVKELLFCNVTSTDYNVTVYFAPSGVPVGDANTVMSTATISARTTVRLPMNTFLAAGATVQGLANSANKIMFLVSAVEYS